MNPQQLKAYRQSLGLSQAQMSKYLGVPLNTYKNWELGKREPDSAPKRLISVLKIIEVMAPDIHEVMLKDAIGKRGN